MLIPHTYVLFIIEKISISVNIQRNVSMNLLIPHGIVGKILYLCSLIR